LAIGCGVVVPLQFMNLVAVGKWIWAESVGALSITVVAPFKSSKREKDGKKLYPVGIQPGHSAGGPYAQRDPYRWINPDYSFQAIISIYQLPVLHQLSQAPIDH
jgi:hypothetical protein